MNRGIANPYIPYVRIVNPHEALPAEEAALREPKVGESQGSEGVSCETTAA